LSAPVVDRIREGIEEKRSRLSEWLEAANPEGRAQALGPMAESAVQAHLAQLRDLERELQLAQGVQRELLPQEVPDVPGLQIAAYSRPALGLTEEAEYADILTLYTGGIPESFDLKGEQFGQDRLEALFRMAAPVPAPEAVRIVREALQAFVGEHPPSDDITLIVLRGTGS